LELQGIFAAYLHLFKELFPNSFAFRFFSRCLGLQKYNFFLSLLHLTQIFLSLFFNLLINNEKNLHGKKKSNQKQGKYQGISRSRPSILDRFLQDYSP
jgi:hypothetical protein